MKTIFQVIQIMILCLLLVILTGCAAAETPTPEPTASPFPPTATTKPTVTTEPTAIPTSIPADTPVLTTLSWNKKADMPTPRFGFSTSVVDGKIYVIGGVGTGGGPAFTTVDMYDPATDTWAAKADMSIGRKWFSTSVVDGKIYAIGGASGPDWFSPSSASVEMYDPATDTWTTKADLPIARDSLAAVMLDGKIYAIGGAMTTAPAEQGSWVTLVDIYDPATDTWTAGRSMQFAKETKAVVIDGKIYATDGFTSEVYDPTKKAWSRMAKFPESSVYVATICDLEGRIYTFGGLDVGPMTPNSGVFVYDPASNTWAQLEDIPFSGWLMTASEVNGKIYLFGGLTGALLDSVENPQPLSSVWEVSIEP